MRSGGEDKTQEGKVMKPFGFSGEFYLDKCCVLCVFVSMCVSLELKQCINWSLREGLIVLNFYLPSTYLDSYTKFTRYLMSLVIVLVFKNWRT